MERRQTSFVEPAEHLVLTPSCEVLEAPLELSGGASFFRSFRWNNTARAKTSWLGSRSLVRKVCRANLTVTR